MHTIALYDHAERHQADILFNGFSSKLLIHCHGSYSQRENFPHVQVPLDKSCHFYVFHGYQMLTQFTMQFSHERDIGSGLGVAETFMFGGRVPDYDLRSIFEDLKEGGSDYVTITSAIGKPVDLYVNTMMALSEHMDLLVLREGASLRISGLIRLLKENSCYNNYTDLYFAMCRTLIYDDLEDVYRPDRRPVIHL